MPITNVSSEKDMREESQSTMRNTSRYSIFFDAKISRGESDNLRDSWLAEVEQMPGFVHMNMFHDNKIRHILLKREKWGTLEIAPHEWGVEYVFIAVASGVAANIIFEILKTHLPLFIMKLKETHSNNYKTIKIDIQIDTQDGPIDIAVIQDGDLKFVITVEELSEIIVK